MLAERFLVLRSRFHGGSGLSVVPEGGTVEHSEEGRGGDAAAGTRQKHLQGDCKQTLSLDTPVYAC